MRTLQLFNRWLVIIATSMLSVVCTFNDAVADPPGGKMGVWFGTNNSGATYYPSNGTGGTVQYSQNNNSFSGNYLDNQNAGPNYQGTSTSAPIIYETSSNKEPMYFRVVPATNYKIKWIRYGRIGELYDENEDGHLIGDQKYDSVSVSSSNATTGVTFERDIKDGKNRFIWVLFESTSTSTATYSATASIVPDYVASTTLCSTTGVITTPATSPYTIAGITGGSSAVFKFKNTATNCELEGISFNDSTDFNQAGVTGPDGSGEYTYTKSIATDSTVKIRFRRKGFLVTSTINPVNGSCGTVSPVSVTVTSGEAYDFTIIPAAGCAISQVVVTDKNPLKNYAATDVTTLEPTILNGGKYTFSNVTQTGNTISVIFVQTSATLGVGYCQVPPFIGGMSSNKPNALIIFDNSGSMSSRAYSGKTYSSSAPYNMFYGYFDNSRMYVQDGSVSNKYNLAPTSTTLDLSSNLSGNRLNYDNMERVDVIRKILIGGKVDSSIVARGATGTKYLKTNSGKLVEYGVADPTGVLQPLRDRVRFGLMVFNSNGSNVESSNPATTGTGDGGHIVTALGADTISTPTIVAAIESNATDPNSWTPLAESMYEAIRYYQAKPSAYNTGVDYGTMDPVISSCQKHFVLLLTDGEPTNDQNVPGGSSANVTDSSLTTWYSGLTDTTYKPTALLPRMAYYAHNNDMRTATVGLDDKTGMQNITLYSVFAFGSGSTTLKDAAKYGAYIDSNNNKKPDIAAEYAVGYYEATDGDALEKNIELALSSIVSSTASGTAAAVANNKSGERGANMIQALFYPQWPDNASVKWLGEVQALWYYLDPIINYSGIYEDTTVDKKLNLNNDGFPPSDPFATKALWRAGKQLQIATAASRNIYTLIDSSSILTSDSNKFISDNLTTTSPTLQSMMNVTSAQAVGMLNYIRGEYNPLYRPRSVSFLDPTTNATTTGEWKLGDIINSTPQVQSSVALNAYQNAYSDTSYADFIKTTAYKARNVVYTGSNDGMFHAFKLGTVTRLSDAANPYAIAEMTDTDARTTHPEIGGEEWAFIPKNALPYIQNQAGIDYCHQNLVDGAPTVVDASINKYANCKMPDGTTTATDYWDCERKVDSWKTVVVSSMGLGGASRDFSGTCNETYEHTSTNSAYKTDCVKSPITGVGLSSYFALDVTNPVIPAFKWEFSDASIAADTSADAADRGLGFTTPGAVIIRVNAADASDRPGKKRNGRWFAVMASGPTGAIDSGNLQFTGHSDQNLKIYIVDLNATMPFTKGTNYWVKDTQIPFAFANSLSGAAIDLDRWSSTKDGNYSDDVVYITYTKASLTSAGSPAKDYPASATAWNKGGIIRLVTNHNPDPSTWFLSSLIGSQNDIGPITTSVGRIQDRANKKLWVYFGEGRYFFPGDEMNSQRKFYGIADPCYNQYTDSTSTYSQYTGDGYSNYALGTTATSCPEVAIGDLQDQTASSGSPATTLGTTKKGWFVNLAAASGSIGAERVVSDVSAAFNGTIFYTTFIPNLSDVCQPGGSTSMWAVKYDTGGTPSSGALIGKAPIQTSSGGVKLIDLATSFTESSGRKLTGSLSPLGMAPKGKFPPLLSPKAVKQILNIQER